MTTPPDLKLLLDVRKRECNRYTNGQCSNRACMVRSGWESGPPDFTQATCEDHETVVALESLSTRIKELDSVEVAAKALVAKLDECLPHIDNAFVMEAIRGRPYSGPQYGKELETLRTALSSSQSVLSREE